MPSQNWDGFVVIVGFPFGVSQEHRDTWSPPPLHSPRPAKVTPYALVLLGGFQPPTTHFLDKTVTLSNKAGACRVKLAHRQLSAGLGLGPALPHPNPGPPQGRKATHWLFLAVVLPDANHWNVF